MPVSVINYLIARLRSWFYSVRNTYRSVLDDRRDRLVANLLVEAAGGKPAKVPKRFVRSEDSFESACLDVMTMAEVKRELSRRAEPAHHEPSRSKRRLRQLASLVADGEQSQFADMVEEHRKVLDSRSPDFGAQVAATLETIELRFQSAALRSRIVVGLLAMMTLTVVYLAVVREAERVPSEEVGAIAGTDERSDSAQPTSDPVEPLLTSADRPLVIVILPKSWQGNCTDHVVSAAFAGHQVASLADSRQWMLYQSLLKHFGGNLKIDGTPGDETTEATKLVTEQLGMSLAAADAETSDLAVPSPRVFGALLAKTDFVMFAGSDGVVSIVGLGEWGASEETSER